MVIFKGLHCQRGRFCFIFHERSLSVCKCLTQNCILRYYFKSVPAHVPSNLAIKINHDIQSLCEMLQCYIPYTVLVKVAIVIALLLAWQTSPVMSCGQKRGVTVQ